MVSLTFAMQSLVSLQAIRIFVCELARRRWYYLRTPFPVERNGLKLSEKLFSKPKTWAILLKYLIFGFMHAFSFLTNFQIAIPYSTILEVERSSAMDFSETIEVKVLEKEGNYSVDSYFFAYFRDLSAALEQIRDAVRNVRNIADQKRTQVLDTTVARSSIVAPVPEHPNTTQDAGPSKSSPFSRLSSFLRPFSETGFLAISSGTAPASEPHEGFTHVTRRSNSFVPVTESPKPIEFPLTSSPTSDGHQETPRLQPQAQPANHTYPPSTFSQSIVPDLPSFRSSSWVGVPSWLKARSKYFTSVIPPLPTVPSDVGVKEVYSPTASSPSSPTSKAGGWGDMTFSILETPHVAVDPDMTDKFRTAFAYDEREVLLGCR